MRIIVFSDSHGRKYDMERIIAEQSGASYIIFLGDFVRDIEDIEALFPDKRLLAVVGNCDRGADGKYTDLITVCGRRIMFTHGHIQRVKYGLHDLKRAARAAKADIVLYGHTHVAHNEYDDGLYVFNPGSISRPREGRPSYGIIDIVPEGIMTNIVCL